jgi:HEAT repeat protein
MSSLFFLIMMGIALGCNGRDAIFLKTAGPEALPYMYMLNAVLMIALSSVYTIVVDRIARHRFLIMLLIFFASNMLVLRMMFPLNYVWLPYAIFGLSEVITLTLYMHFWTFANDMFDPREGKRLFPLIGGVGLLGTMVGGTITKFIASTIRTENLFTLWTVLLLLSIPITKLAYSTRLSFAFASASSQRLNEDKPSDELSISAIWKVPLLRTLAYISIPMWIVICIVDFQFNLAMNSVFPIQDELTAFFGLFNGIVSLTGLLLQFFLTGRLLQRFGVGIASLVYPVSLTMGSVAITARFGFLSSIFAKFSDNVIFYSTGESASQLLFNALPEEKRGRARALVSGYAGPICTALAGVLLIAFNFFLPLYASRIFAVALGIVWISLALKIRSNYLHALVENLSSNSIELRASAVSKLSQMKGPEATQALLNSVLLSNEDVALFALELLEQIGNDNLADKLCNLLPDSHPKVKVAILSSISKIGKQDNINAVRPMLNHSDHLVRAAAIRAIGKLGTNCEIDPLEQFLNDPSLDVKAEAIIAQITLANRTGIDHKIVLNAMKAIEDMSVNFDPNYQAKLAYVLGEVQLERFRPLLLELLHADDENVQCKAISAIGKTPDRQVVQHLVKLFDVERLVPVITESILHLGEIAVEPLGDELRSEIHNDIIKANIALCLGQLGSASCIPTLLDCLDGKPNPVGNASIKALAKIKTKLKEKYPALDRDRNRIYEYLNSLVEQIECYYKLLYVLKSIKNDYATIPLVDALQWSAQRYQEITFKCLELLAEPEVIQAAATSLKGMEPRTQAEAIEALESSCPEARLLVNLFEKQIINPEHEVIDDKTSYMTELMERVLTFSDEWTQACAIYTSGELNLIQLKERILEKMNEESQIIRFNAQDALYKMGVLKEGVDEDMASDMEKILFLRSVPLFAGVEGSDLQWISKITQEKEFPSNTTIFEEHEEGSSLYLIVDGSVRIIKKSENKEVVLAILQERDYFGEMAILDNEPRSASAETVKKTKLLVISRENFQQLVVARPSIALSLFKSLSKRLREANKRLLKN